MMHIIRRLGPQDAEKFRDLRLKALKTDADAFVSTLEEEQRLTLPQIAQWIETDYILGAFSGEQLVGTLVFMEQAKKKFKHIGILGGMYVDPAHRQKGLGKELIRKMLQHLRQFDSLYSLQLKVITTNIAAIKLYESFGFECWATEKNALHYQGNYYDQFHMMLILRFEK